GKLREARELPRERLFLAVEMSANLRRQFRHARRRSERKDATARPHPPRRWLAELFPDERRASTAAFRTDGQRYRVAQIYLIKGRIAAEKFYHAPRRGIECGRGV